MLKCLLFYILLRKQVCTSDVPFMLIKAITVPIIK